MDLKELIESFNGFSYAAGNAGQALKTIVGRLRNQVSIDEEPIEYTLVYKEPWEHIEINREEAMWLNKKLPEWSKEYN